MLPSSQIATLADGTNPFLDNDEAPRRLLMPVTIVFSLPPMVVYSIRRRYMMSGMRLTAFRE